MSWSSRGAMRAAKAVMAACVALSLVACGFRLQGREPLPPALQTVQLDATDRHSDFARALRRSLDASGARVVDRATVEGAVVRVLHDRVSENVLSVDARNIPTDLELTYEVEVQVRSGATELMAPEPFEVTRIYSFDETKKLSKEREKDVLREALARDLASMVLRRLTSL